jgi:AraC-like DNA-binding protein
VKARATGEVSVVLLRPIIEAARRAGVDVGALCAAIALDPAKLDDADAAVSGLQVIGAWLEAERLSGDAVIGLHAGEHAPRAGMFDLLDYAVMSAATFGEALERLARYYRILSDFVQLTVERDGDALRFAHRGQTAAFAPMRHAWDAFVAIIVVRARAAFGDAFRPRAVSWVHAAPAELGEHRRLLAGVELAFGQPLNEIVFDAAAAERAIPSADPALGRVMARLADALLAETPDAEEDLAAQTRRVVRERMRGSDVTLEDAAAALRLSARTLQRRLADAGTTYHALVDEERRAAAAQYLASGRVSVREIAFLLGYTQPHAFHRAFRRWHGVTPAAWRAARKK